MGRLLSCFPSCSFFLLLGLCEVVCDSLLARLHGLLSRLPAGGAHLSVLVSELKRLHQAEDLVNVPADGEVVDGHLTDLKDKKELLIDITNYN
jgi:hypothetical protein